MMPYESQLEHVIAYRKAPCATEYHGLTKEPLLREGRPRHGFSRGVSSAADPDTLYRRSAPKIRSLRTITKRRK